MMTDIKRNHTVKAPSLPQDEMKLESSTLPGVIDLQNIKNITQGLTNSSTYPLQQAEQLNSTYRYSLNKTFGEEIFIPSKEQMEFLRAAFNPKTGTELQDWLQHAHISEESLAFWWNNPNFVHWITAEAERRMLLFRLEWLAVGVKKMHNNVSTWTTMKDLFFPKGVEHSPAEQGSKRHNLELEIKKLIEKKNESDTKVPKQSKI